MKLNLPTGGLRWVNDMGGWSLQTRGDDPVEVARLVKGNREWEWITFWFSLCPDGAPEIQSGWTSSLKEGKDLVRRSLIESGMVKE